MASTMTYINIPPTLTKDDTIAVSLGSVPLAMGAATAAKQLPDNHQVTVSNHPTEFPLPAAQVATLTPPAAITGYALETGGNLASINTKLVSGTAIGGVQLVSEAGAVYGVKHISNKPRVSSMPYLYDIAEGNVSDHVAWSKIGYNDNIGSTQETMWSYSSEYVFPTVAGQMEVVSSDANDNGGGTGARTVRIGYLKSDYSESSVTLTLSGLTPVATGASHADIWRINSFRVETTGTGLAPAGNLTLRNAGGATVYSYIRQGKTRDRACFYTVPIGKTLYVTSIAFSGVGTKYLVFTTHANLEQATGAILQRGLFHPFSEVALLNSSYTKVLEMPTKLPATVDLKVSVVAEDAGSLATCHLRGWLE